MNKLIPFALFLCLLLNKTGYSQKIDSVWAFDHDSTSDTKSHTGNSLFDADSNIYMCVSLGTDLPAKYTDIEFGPGETPVYEKGNKIIKYDRNFNLIWSKNVRGKLSMFISAINEDRIYLSGVFEDTVDFNPDPSITLNKVSRNKNSYYLLELDNAGNFKRVVVFEGLKSGVFFTNFSELNVRRNPDHTFFIHNSIDDSLDLDPGAGKIPIGGRLDAGWNYHLTSFLVHLDSNFNYLAHINVPGGIATPSATSPLNFSITANKIILSGQQKIALYPDRNQPLFEIPTDSGKEFIVIEYDQNLNYLGFKKPFRGSGEMDFEKLHYGTNGEVFLFGSFNGSLILEPNIEELKLQSSGWSDAVVVKFNNLQELKPLGTYHVGGAFNEKATFVGTVQNNQILLKVYLASETNFAPSPDFDPGPDTLLIDKNATYGIALVRLDPDLNFRWAGSIRPHLSDFYFRSLTPINDSTLFLFGLVQGGKVDFDLSWNNGFFYCYPTGSRDVFVTYHFPKPTYHNTQSTICGQDSFKFKHNYLRQSGSYTNTFSGSDSRDSVVTLDLTVHPSYFMQETALFCPEFVENWHGQTISAAGYYYDSLKTTLGCDSVFRKEVSYRSMNAASVQQSGPNLLVATSGFTSYQWVDCYANYTPIQGADQDFYQTPHGGLYGAVVTDQNGCSDTTNCIQVQGVGLNGIDPSSVSVYPNPFSDVLHIDGLQPGATFRLVNTLGMELLYSLFTDTTIDLQLGELPSGIYFLEIAMDGRKQSVKVVKTK